ncbi:MAG TPA: thioredoxin domain-containing protein [Solirubrobacteraceae bacterium]|nr:thioredoxin domain-containing protein [Solirubrobacteraceae bacterium]
MTNALAGESSPYLRQHAENPVDWRPWGPQAFAAARERDVPVLVSIGYSACHWCHVMERESFADEQTATLMNANFVCVKVDREERPDVDAIYMEAVQSMIGSGGWPLNVFVSPDQLPLYGGTYFPPQPRPGMISWRQLLVAIAATWRDRRDELLAGGELLRSHLAGGAVLEPSSAPPAEAALDAAVERLRGQFDAAHGGFGGAPKFPQTPVLEFLLARGERTMALATLRGIEAGGIHDRVGGGFARYSVDDAWRVPHFEKMLYDNALLARAMLHGWQASGERALLDACRDALDWALAEMRDPSGGFYSALDADSEGAEGAYYVWTIEQLRDALGALGADAQSAIAYFQATAEGNFSDPHHPARGLNVLQGTGPRPDEQSWRRIREALKQRRDGRPRPALDDKCLTAWNALMIAALADAGAALGEERYTRAATDCARFIQTSLRGADGRLLRVWRDGPGEVPAFLEDHALLLEALLVLFETTCEERWFHDAVAVARDMIELFADVGRGGFYTTGSDAEPLIARRKELDDTPIPSGQSAAAAGLIRLAQLTGEARYDELARATLGPLRDIAPEHPTAFGHALLAQHTYLAPAKPVACPVPVTGSTGSAPAPSS